MSMLRRSKGILSTKYTRNFETKSHTPLIKAMAFSWRSWILSTKNVVKFVLTNCRMQLSESFSIKSRSLSKPRIVHSFWSTVLAAAETLEDNKQTNKQKNDSEYLNWTIRKESSQINGIKEQTCSLLISLLLHSLQHGVSYWDQYLHLLHHLHQLEFTAK